MTVRVPCYISIMKDGVAKDVFSLIHNKKEILDNGFTIIENVFSETEVDAVIETIDRADTSKPTFRKTKDLFAIRQFLKEVPEVTPLIFTERLTKIINQFW